MWITLEDADPNDTEPDSTQRAISALLSFGFSIDSPTIRRACKALERFILEEALEWEKNHPPVWPWIAFLDGLAAAGYSAENKALLLDLKGKLARYFIEMDLSNMHYFSASSVIYQDLKVEGTIKSEKLNLLQIMRSYSVRKSLN